MKRPSRLYNHFLNPLGRIALRLAICLALLLPQAPALVQAAPASAPPAQAACPTGPSSFPDMVDRTEFCVRYDDTDTTAAQATTVADLTQLYWDRYVDELGFRTPLYTDKLVVEVRNNASCNGATDAGINYLYIYNGCFTPDGAINKVTGHELFHRVQLASADDLTAGLWLFEGTARLMEDLAFADIDNWVNAMSSSSSFNQQVNTYLNNTNVDITDIAQRYNSALWWKFFTEQYGTITTEPERGVDAIVELWEAAETSDDIAAVNAALNTLGAGQTFDSAFRRFVLANWTKDLAGQPDGSYNYIDEDEANNPAPYGPVLPADGGTIAAGSPAMWGDQFISRYGASYYVAQPGDNCPVVNATLHTDSGPAFYHVVAESGGTLVSHEEGAAIDMSRSFFNNGLSRILVVAGSTDNDAQVDVTLQCLNPQLEIRMPNNVAVAHVGPYDDPGKLLAQVLVTDGKPDGPIIAGFTPDDFIARVNGIDATITTGAFIQEQYWLQIQAPVQGADGLYSLEIVLKESGTTNPIASDINANSVLYSPDNLDHALVLDRSGSMSLDGKMQAAQDAANFYVDITRDSDGLAVVPFSDDVTPTPFDMRSVDATARADATNYINGLTTGNATSIGDGMQEAANQRNGSPTGNPDCSFVLLSDGMENSPQYWADVQSNVLATGCPVTTIAFGESADETLMQDIATATGGSFFYNDVYVSSNTVAAAGVSADSIDDTALELGSTYEYAQGAREGRQRLLDEDGFLPNNFKEPFPDHEHTVAIDGSIDEALFALKWNGGGCIQGCKTLVLKLLAPDGKLYTEQSINYSFKNLGSGHVGWRIPNPVPGVWTLLVNHINDGGEQDEEPYRVLVSAHTDITAELLLPDRLGSRYLTGNRIPIYALLSGNGPLQGVDVRAQITAPDGSQSIVQLYDDGQHGDGAAGDGFYAGIYQRVNQADPVAPPQEDIPGGSPPTPKDEGSYLVRLLATRDQLRREVRGSFTVLESPDENKNRLPDAYEKEYGVDNPEGDDDLDGLSNYDEYQIGTNPQDSDTDDGGENDGSEWFNNQSPFDPKDDNILEPEFFEATPIANAVKLRFHVRDDYEYFILYRGPSRNGPWTLINDKVPPTGEYIDGGVENGKEYYYRMLAVKPAGNTQGASAAAVNATTHGSAVVASKGVIPSADPFRPEAKILINDRAPDTDNLKVVLSFVPYEDEEYFNDIKEMKLGHTPALAGASWQPFQQKVEWQLSPVNYDEYATVYARFRDAAGNVSLLEQANILYVRPDATPTPTPTVEPTPTPEPTVTPDPDAGAKPLESLDLGLRRKAEQFLEDMRGNPMAPGWERARLGDRVRDLFRPDVEGPAYQEFQVLDPEGGPAGFILISTGDHDLPIPHWNFEGETPTEHVEREAAQKGKIIKLFFKLDALTYAGEGPDGKLAALVGNDLIKVDGLDPNVLEDGLDLTHERWRPERDTANDGEVGGLDGIFEGEGPQKPDGMELDGWESWEGLKEQFSEAYETLTGSLDRESERDWEIDREAQEEGEGLFAGIQYSITLITEDPPTVTVRGEGVERDLLDSVVIERPDLPSLLQLDIQGAIPDVEVPFEVELDFGGNIGRETLEFSIIDRSRLPTRFQLVNDVFLPLAMTEPRFGGGRPLNVNASGASAPGAEEREWGEWTYAWAGGHGDQRLYEQIPSSHSSNNTGCASGSAATSWAMLFGWADKQAAQGNSYWQPRWGLYREGGGTGANVPAPGGMDDGIRTMMWEIHNAIGTWCAEDSQPTAPWNMEQAAQYFRDRSGAQLDTHYNVQGLLDGELRDYVIESIRDRGTPAVIGTGWLTHYALAYGYAWRSRSVEECDDNDICWEETEYNHLFYVNRGEGGANNGWVAGNTWFVGEIRP